jgi:hypothetical protein
VAGTARPIESLSSRDPSEGDRLQFRGASWKVTERSTYNNEDGYRCVEWTCECGDVEGYLLKETEKDNVKKWFFTLTLDAGKVKLPAGEAVDDWIKRTGNIRATKETPELQYRGQSYQYADKTEGTYTDDSGERTPKTTWDYWDAEHKNNLAIEIWESGEVAAYLGNYIRSADVAFSARPNVFSDHHAFSADWLKFGAYAFFFAFYVLAEVGGAVDVIVTLILGAGLLFGWMYPVMDALWVAAASAATAAGLAFLFWFFPPFTTPVGFMAFLGAPAFLTWFIRQTNHTLSDRAARTHIAYALELPLIFLGFTHYFKHAPAPHDFGQYCLALAPAAVGAVVAWSVTTFMFSDWGPLGPQSLHEGDGA